MSKHTIKRRTLLRGLLGGTAISVGLPTLEVMLNRNGTALAQGAALPRRLGVFFWGNGVRLKFWIPAAQGPGWALSPALEPLAPVKDYLNVVSGMDIKIPSSQGHHTGEVGILSGYPLVSQPKGGAPFRSTFSAPSIDQVAAAELGKTTRFRSLEVGISRRVNTREGTTLQFISHNGPDSANPPDLRAGRRVQPAVRRRLQAARRCARAATRARSRKRRPCAGASWTPSAATWTA